MLIGSLSRRTPAPASQIRLFQEIHQLFASSKPPAPEKMLTELPDEPYEQVMRRAEKSRNINGILFLSKIKHTKGENILTVIKNVDGEVYFLKSFEFSENTKLEKIITDAVGKAKTLFNVNI